MGHECIVEDNSRITFIPFSLAIMNLRYMKDIDSLHGHAHSNVLSAELHVTYILITR